MTNRLEELRSEADKFESFDSFFAGLPPDREKDSVWRYERYLIEYNKKLITLTYTQAIQDAIGALPNYGGDPECEHGFLNPKDDCPNVSCEKRAILYLKKDLQALLPQQ